MAPSEQKSLKRASPDTNEDYPKKMAKLNTTIPPTLNLLDPEFMKRCYSSLDTTIEEVNTKQSFVEPKPVINHQAVLPSIPSSTPQDKSLVIHQYYNAKHVEIWTAENIEWYVREKLR